MLQLKLYFALITCKSNGKRILHAIFILSLHKIESLLSSNKGDSYLLILKQLLLCLRVQQMLFHRSQQDLITFYD